MTDKIKITILLFVQAREMAGAASLAMQVAPPATVASVFARLTAELPKLAAMERSLLFAVNETYAGREQPLNDGDQLAVLPPVSGGAGDDICEITRGPIDLADLRARLLEGDSGAVVIFDGVARNHTKGRRT